VLRAGETVAYELPADEPAGVEAEDVSLRVVYEDDWLLVVDKPAGVVVHPAPGHEHGTLVHGLVARGIRGGHGLRPGIVHRLDKGTSGVMVVARTDAALRALARQFKNRAVKKEYLALVHGKVVPGAGTIDAPLGRDPRDRKKISPRARKQRTAITRYETLETFGACTLLKIRPETGRTHQIRVHLATRGYPVVGDTLYGGRRRLQPQVQRLVEKLDRFFLHASRIEFQHPSTGMQFSAKAKLPPELKLVLEALRGGRADREMPVTSNQ
jgi:23S rRNA pseudouridine1911/1915/1917 synthase